MAQSLTAGDTADAPGSGSQRVPLAPAHRLALETSFVRLALRSVRWLLVCLRFFARWLWDSLHGRRDPRTRGRRLRRAFEEMGGTAIKVGQQLSVRIDLLPYEVCDELSQLLDRVRPFPVEVAIRRIEETTGKRLEELFEAFDPEPIGSASIACVYQACLRSGDKVAVKVRRPDVTRQFATDLRFIDGFTHLPEILAMVRPGFFKYLRTELREMLSEELDFEREARYQRLFRRLAGKARLDWLTAPRVYTEYSGADVLVSELVEGISCREILAALDSGDRDALAALEALNISPKRVATRVLHTQFWSSYESLFFHADPHPSNIMVQAGSKLVFLDFGACGTTSEPVQRNQQALLDRLVRDDIDGMAEAALHLLAPLPPIHLQEFKRRILDAYQRVIYAVRDKKSQWWERTTMSLWLVMMQITQDFQLPINLDVMRQFRCSLLYDTLAFRLYGQLKLPAVYRSYRRGAAHRAVRLARRQAEKITSRRARDEVLRQIDTGVERAEYAAWGADTLIHDSLVELEAAINKGAYAVMQMLHFLARATVLLGAVAGASLAWRALAGGRQAGSWLDFLRAEVLASPALLGALGVLLLIHLRRLLLRLRECDDQGRRGRWWL